ncbi:MAG TPA: hypothetical protein VFE36_08885 [Candidatus Baltobacteraceae bacterium]|jgi:hypothetical protein|nr:hypothetical protein [Candidatus Baltobacteraceae bacterium]
MSTPARYWIVVFAFAAVLCACAGRTGAPLPFVPQTPALSTVEDATLESPDVLRCATDKAQPGWVFRGVCKYVHKLHDGKSIKMPVYAGFVVTIRIPKNSAGTGQKIIAAVANRTDVAARKGRHRLGRFPTDKNAFLYFKTVNVGLPIRFRKHTRVVFDLTNGSGTALGTPCTIDVLQRSNGTNTWKTLPVAGTISGKVLTFSISRRHYASIPHGAAYYAFICASAPTPSPSPSTKPTSTPTTKPSSTPSAGPAYCANYSVPSTNTVQVNIADKSGLGAAVVMYVWNGSHWMNSAGAFAATSANPIPLSCFPGSSGARKKGTHFALPTGLAAARLYISYAVPSSTTVAPNPLAGMPPGGPAPTYGGTYYGVPWDVVELGTTSGAIVDLTAVTNLGLPIEMAQASPGKSPFVSGAERAPRAAAPRAIPAPCATSGAGIIGVTSCNYANIYTAMSAIPQYRNLVATAKFNGTIVDLRIINPAKAQGAWNFGSDWFYNPAYLAPYPTACSGVPTPLANGYLSCVLAAYQKKSRLYATAGSGVSKVSGSNYCVSSDGSANFGFTKVGTATSCAGITFSSPGTFAMPISLFKYGTPPVSSDGKGCDAGFLFGLPPNNKWITSGSSKHPSKHPNVFGTADAFAIWKGLAIDLNRGAALSTGSHPAGGWAQNFASPAAFSDYYNDPVYNDYAYVMHYYYDHHQSYALSYDEPGGQASAFAYVTGNALDIMVNPVPTAAAISPVSTPAPYPLPSPCTVFPTNVGG